MSLSLIAQTYNFEGDEDAELIDNVQITEELSGETEGSTVQLEITSGNSLPTRVAQDGEASSSTVVSTDCTKKNGRKSRTKRTGNWMWTYKSQRAPRPKRRRMSKNKKAQSLPDIDIPAESATNDKLCDIDNERVASSTPTVNPADSLTEERNDWGIEPFKCPFCLQVNLGREGLIEHLMIVHKVHSPDQEGDQLIEAVKIEVTPDILVLSDGDDDSAEMSLKKNAKTRGTSSSREFKCHLCDMSLSTRANLRRHMKIHEQSWRPWKCSKCKSFFNALSHLRAHENLVHNRKLGLSCRKGFSRSKSSNHLKSVHGKKSLTPVLKSSVDYLNTGTGSKATSKLSLNGIHTLVKRTIQRRRTESLRQNMNSKRSKVKTTQIKVAEVSCENNSAASGGKETVKQSLASRPKLKRALQDPKCNQCGLSFNSFNNLQRHMKVHKEEANRPWKCTQCCSFFKRVHNLRLHENQLHGRKPGTTKYPCRVCRKQFQREKLVIHMRIHSQELPYKCPRCKNLFRQIVHLQRHLKRAHGVEKKYTELKLSPEYQNSEITNPEQIVDGASQNYIVSSSSPFSNNEKDENSDVDTNQAFKCPYCFLVITENEKFIQHLQAHKMKGEHESSKRSQDDVGAEGSHRRNVGIFENKCDVCKTTFRGKKNNLKRHMSIHDATNRPWKCTRCSSFFLTANQLRIHENRAHNRTPGNSKCICNICGKAFPQASLAVHMRIHNGERPFGCLRCDKRFRQLEHLKGHLRKVHGMEKSTAELKLLESPRPEQNTLRPQGNLPVSDQFRLRVCKIILSRCDENDNLKGKASIASKSNIGSKAIPRSRFPIKLDSSIRTRRKTVEHEVIQTKAKPFACELCPISFGYRRSVKRHYIRIHFGARPHKCSKCDKAFYLQDDLEMHSAVHVLM